MSSLNLVAMSAAASCLIFAASVFAPAQLASGAIAKGAEPSMGMSYDIVEETVGQKTFQVSRTIVKARPDQVFRILTDYNNAVRVFPHLKKCQVLEDHGNTKVVDHEIEPSGPFGTFEYVLEIKETAPKTLEWHRLRGDFREVDGFWKLEAVEGGRYTLVTYSTHINGGLFMPAALIKRQVRTDMPSVMAALKTQAESGQTQIAGRPVAVHHN